MIRIAILGSLAFFATLAAGEAAEPAAIYSSVCMHPETGDLLGFRIAVMRFPDTKYVMFQIAEGSMEAPELAEATLDGHALSFTLESSGRWSFSGTITEKALKGRLNIAGNQEVLNLPRLHRTARLPICR